MSIECSPGRVAQDGTSMCTFRGDPWVTVEWTLTGPGTLTPFSPCTNASGVAQAKYEPGGAPVGTVVEITVKHGLMP
jgi:hypothetical protein